MIKEIFCYLADQMKETGLFNLDRVYEYVDLIKTSTSTESKSYTERPKYYKGSKVGWVDVMNWDVNGTCYFRKTGKTLFMKKREKWQSCSNNRILEARLPIRFVACVPKTKLDDSPFMFDQLAQDLIGVLQGNYDNLAVDISAHEVRADVNSTETNPNKVWESEIKGVDFTESVVQKFAYISIDFTLVVKGDAGCLQTCLTNGY